MFRSDTPASRHRREYPQLYASVLFVAIITRGVSLLNLAPHTPWAAKKVEHWDYASMTGIVRTMIELRSAFHYLCVDECSLEEWNCRWNIFNLHDCVSRIRLFDAQGANEEVEKLKVQAEELRERIRTRTLSFSRSTANGTISFCTVKRPISIRWRRSPSEREWNSKRSDGSTCCFPHTCTRSRCPSTGWR